MKIGRFVEIDLRELWAHEQYDFSHWLSKEENIELINDEIGLNLVNVTREVFVGPYRCDIVAKDEITGETVIIENQLEATNHDHLGKIIAYAAGLKATTIIWIVKEAKEEHKAAIEWLNNNMVSDISFFLIELHAYKINDSLPAPMFKIIEKPNNFIKTNKNSNSGELRQSESYRIDFWNKFNEMIIKAGNPFPTRKATINHWYSVALGTSQAHINITLVNKTNNIGVEVNIPDNKELFDNLYSFKDDIENKLGFKLDWMRLEDKKASRIITYIPGFNFEDQSNHEELMKQIINTVVLFKKVFKLYLK